MIDSSLLITILGSPDWLEQVQSLVSPHEMVITQYQPDGATPAHLIDHLLDHFPALIMLDGDDPHSISWITTLRVEQATRRIPVLALGADIARKPIMLAAGALAYLLLSELETRLLTAVQTHARQLTPAEREQLDCQCAEPLPPLAQLGVHRFNAGAYYAQHDAFEELWMEETGPVRELYRVVLQVGVAYYHLSRGNYAGGLKMLRRTAQWFALLPDECQGIDVRQLHVDATRIRHLLRTLHPAEIDRTWFTCVPLLDGPIGDE